MERYTAAGDRLQKDVIDECSDWLEVMRQELAKQGFHLLPKARCLYDRKKKIKEGTEHDPVYIGFNVEVVGSIPFKLADVSRAASLPIADYVGVPTVSQRFGKELFLASSSTAEDHLNKTEYTAEQMETCQDWLAKSTKVFETAGWQILNGSRCETVVTDYAHGETDQEKGVSFKVVGTILFI